MGKGYIRFGRSRKEADKQVHLLNDGCFGEVLTKGPGLARLLESEAGVTLYPQGKSQYMLYQKSVILVGIYSSDLWITYLPVLTRHG